MLPRKDNRLAIGANGICLSSREPSKYEKQLWRGLATPSLTLFLVDSFIHFLPSSLYIVYIHFQMAKAASNKSPTKMDLNYPEIEEEALQFILDSCEASISKYSRFLKVNKNQNNSSLWLSGENCNASAYGCGLFCSLSNCRKVDRWIWTLRLQNSWTEKRFWNS